METGQPGWLYLDMQLKCVKFHHIVLNTYTFYIYTYAFEYLYFDIEY